MAEPTVDRLTRLLALITYLREHQGVPITEVADHFGVTPAQVLADVNLLWVTGTPGYLPDDLIDFSGDALERDVVTLTEARGMDRPLRLSTDEALSLLVALRALEALVADGRLLGEGPQALASAAGKLQEAAGAAAARAEAVDVALDVAAPGWLELARQAVTAGRRLHLRYVSAADEVTERDVDPLELSTDGSVWFLRAWCHRTAAERTFRLDRVLRAELRPEAVTHATPEPRAPAPELGPDLPVVTLELASRARWVAEHVPVESVGTREDGTLQVTVRVADRAWLTNLVLSLGDSVLSVDPPSMAGQVARRARAALAAYDALS